MNNYDVPFELQSRVRKYLEYNLKNESRSDCESSILNKLNNSLKKELMMESLGKFLKSVSFFRENFTDSSLEKFVFALKKLQLSPEEFLYKVVFFYF